MNIDQPVVLRSSKGQWVLTFIFSLLFLTAGLWILQQRNSSGTWIVGFFGLSAIVSGIQLFTDASYLKLSREGLEICSLYRKWTHRWNEINQFVPGQIGMQRLVTLKYSSEYRGGMQARKILKKVGMAEGALPDTYGMSAEELAELLTLWKEAVESV